MAMKRKGTMQKSGVLPEKVRSQFELLQHELNITFVNKNLLYQAFTHA